MANSQEKASDESGYLAVVDEEFFRFQISALVEAGITPVFKQEFAAEPYPDPVVEKRPQDAADHPADDYRHTVHFIFPWWTRYPAGGENDLRRQGDERTLYRHENDQSGIAQLANDGGYQVQYRISRIIFSPLC